MARFASTRPCWRESRSIRQRRTSIWPKLTGAPTGPRMPATSCCWRSRPPQDTGALKKCCSNCHNRNKENKKRMSSTTTEQLQSEDLKVRIGRFRQVDTEIVRQVRRVIVGQEEVLEQIMIGLFVGGHCLITGLPGTAKTLLVRTLAQTLGLVFKRIQFTPDLMPSDITGTDIIEEDMTTGHRTWTFVQGPIFANILLADEINRTPPKTQSALLEAMQERSCTVRGNNYKLPAPFFV